MGSLGLDIRLSAHLISGSFTRLLWASECCLRKRCPTGQSPAGCPSRGRLGSWTWRHIWSSQEASALQFWQRGCTWSATNSCAWTELRCIKISVSMMKTSFWFRGLFGPMLRLCWAYVGPRTACSFWAWCQGLKGHAVLGTCWEPRWAYVGPMLSLGRAYVGPCWALVGPKRGASFKPWFKSDDKNEPLVFCAMLGPCRAYAELMLGQERRPNAYAAFESCRGHVGPTLGLCWYVPVGWLNSLGWKVYGWEIYGWKTVGEESLGEKSTGERYMVEQSAGE